MKKQIELKQDIINHVDTIVKEMSILNALLDDISMNNLLPEEELHKTDSVFCDAFSAMEEIQEQLNA